MVSIYIYIYKAREREGIAIRREKGRDDKLVGTKTQVEEETAGETAGEGTTEEDPLIVFLIF